MQLWLIAASIVALAVVLAVSITSLRGNADHARQVQLIVAGVNGDAQRISRIEWEATANGRFSRELGEEFQLVNSRVHRLLRDYKLKNPAHGRQLDRQTLPYLAAVANELALLDRGRLAESREVDERDVDPSFDRLQDRLHEINAAQKQTAHTAAVRTDVGITVSLLLAALILIVLLARLDRMRSAASRERHEHLESQALHDVLTGLPNRRMLMTDLDRAVLRGHAGEQSVLVLCDLDGFKAYNDTFGHLEGDLLLERVSDRLAHAVAPHGTAYRLGGDEFCALLHVDANLLEQALAACHAALSEAGSGFDIRASIGTAALPGEAPDGSAALRLADQRMYAQKNERGSSIKQQLRDLILRVLSEQNPALLDHVHDVARLAAGVGRRLGMNDPDVANLVRAAELHDVGKVAIPDSILDKPGSLDPDEREFMERHTLIGENILGAATALAGVGRLVRSSHERHDGTGYPDGLQGEEIPLSSRIIFVCDSFHAMTTDRPYRRAMTDQDAVNELRRCANTQFDATVVDAFITELAAVDAASRDGGEKRRDPVVASG